MFWLKIMPPFGNGMVDDPLRGNRWKANGWKGEEKNGWTEAENGIWKSRIAGNWARTRIVGNGKRQRRGRGWRTFNEDEKTQKMALKAANGSEKGKDNVGDK